MNKETSTQISEMTILNHELMASFLSRLASMKETRGVCVLGSHARTGIRPKADLYSDFDVALFIDLELAPEHLALDPAAFQRSIQPQLPHWLPNFKFVAPGSENRNREKIPLQVNVHQLVVSYEQQPRIVWPEDRREAFLTTCEIIYDPTGDVKSLIDLKVIADPTLSAKRLRTILATVPVIIEHSVIKCALRGRTIDAQIALVETIDCLVEAAYDLNGRPLPHRKWRFSQLGSLPTLPLDFESRLGSVVQAIDILPESILRKAETIKELARELHELALQLALVSSDVYTEFVTQTSPGWQLRSETSADVYVGANRDQYGKMRDPRWNHANLNLIVY